MGLREEVELKPDIKVGKFKGMGMVALNEGVWAHTQIKISNFK